MFRKMRRFKQQLSNDEALKILKNCKSGVLAVSGDDGYPYTVPLNFVYKDGKIYFHCAKNGHKLDAIKQNKKVSFCVIEKDEVDSEKLTTLFRSVVVFGKAEIMENEEKINQNFAWKRSSYTLMSPSRKSGCAILMSSLARSRRVLPFSWAMPYSVTT